MFTVACFCGCCYSFSDGTGACPRCGTTAVVSGQLPGPGAGRQPAGPETLVLTDGQRTLVLTNVSSRAAEPHAPCPGRAADN
jgi:hypothetical protein